MKRKRLPLALFTATVLCLSCTACGTTALSNAQSYFGNVAKILSASSSSGKNTAASASASAATATPLSAPTDFVVSSDGTFSFKGVENADFYLIYFCAPTATEDSADYLYASAPIEDTGAESYSGKFPDLFQFNYGEFLVKVFAFPELTNSSLEKSSAASASYTATGKQDDPAISYFWNTNDSTLELVLTNVNAYTYEAYPSEVLVTFTNIDDASDTVVAKIADVSDSNYSVSTDTLTKGKTYAITAVSKSSSQYVTNAETQPVTVSEGVTLGSVNILSESYTYSDGWASFPRLCSDFNLEGGVAGVALGRQGAMSADVVAVKVATTAGSTHSYTVKIDFGGFSMDGTLELKNDGTLELSQSGGGPIGAGVITGSWLVNENGTATLSYSPSNIKS